MGGQALTATVGGVQDGNIFKRNTNVKLKPINPTQLTQLTQQPEIDQPQQLKKQEISREGEIEKQRQRNAHSAFGRTISVLKTYQRKSSMSVSTAPGLVSVPEKNKFFQRKSSV